MRDLIADGAPPAVLARVPRPFGGQQLYAVCPGCGGRASLVYRRGETLVCWRCLGLTHAVRQPGAATTAARACIAALAALRDLPDDAPASAWDEALLAAMTTAAAHARACALPLVRILARMERREARRARRRVGGSRTPAEPTRTPVLPEPPPPGFAAALAAAWRDWTAATARLHAVAAALAEHGERLSFDDLVRVLHALGNACAPGLAFLAGAEPRGGRWTVPASVLAGLSRSERRRPTPPRGDATCSTIPAAP